MPSGSFLGKLLAFPYTLRICVLALLLPEGGGEGRAHFEWIINECTRELITKLGVHWSNIEELLRFLNRNRIKRDPSSLEGNRRLLGIKSGSPSTAHEYLRLYNSVRVVQRSLAFFFFEGFPCLRILWTLRRGKSPGSPGRWWQLAEMDLLFLYANFRIHLLSPTGKMLIFKRLAEAERESNAMVLLVYLPR